MATRTHEMEGIEGRKRFGGKGERERGEKEKGVKREREAQATPLPKNACTCSRDGLRRVRRVEEQKRVRERERKVRERRAEQQRMPLQWHPKRRRWSSPAHGCGRWVQDVRLCTLTDSRPAV